jgi:hypothetical protein
MSDTPIRRYVADNPERHAGLVVGDGECVALVRQAAYIPHSMTWRCGEPVLGRPPLERGTCIATFDPDGTYGNHGDGRSHAAIFLEATATGIRVLDQWRGRTAQMRVIRDKRGEGLPADDASQYFVIA